MRRPLPRSGAVERISREIETARARLPAVTHSRADLGTIAALTTSLRVDGHRADLVILRGARAQAAFEGRSAITDRDILLAAELALPHRARKGPLESAMVDLNGLEDRLEQARSEAGKSEKGEPQAAADQTESVKKNRK
ncbi:MAG: hypothetical protein O3B38_01910 [Chloroflexi bacterium]|nr:hypothetical protein [Chloroflexota bacterium]